MKIDELLSRSEELSIQLNVERLKKAEEMLSAIVAKAREESERLQVDSTRAPDVGSVAFELFQRYVNILPLPSSDDVPEWRRSCDEVLKAGSQFLARAEGRELSDTARSNVERLRRRLDVLKRSVENLDREIIPLVGRLDALSEKYRESAIAHETLRVLKLWRDTEKERKQKRARERKS